MFSSLSQNVDEQVVDGVCMGVAHHIDNFFKTREIVQLLIDMYVS